MDFGERRVGRLYYHQGMAMSLGRNNYLTLDDGGQADRGERTASMAWQGNTVNN